MNAIRAIRRIGGRIASAGFFLALTAAHVHAADATGLQNPLNSAFSSIPNFIAGALKVVVYVALPIITLMFVVVGFKFILAQGDSHGLGEAKKNLLYAVIGAILIMGAWVIATLIAGTVTQLVSTS